MTNTIYVLQTRWIGSREYQPEALEYADDRGEYEGDWGSLEEIAECGEFVFTGWELPLPSTDAWHSPRPVVQ